MTNERELTVELASELNIVTDVIDILGVLDFSQTESTTYNQYTVTVDSVAYRIYIEYEDHSLYIPIEMVSILNKHLEDHRTLAEFFQQPEAGVQFVD
jgi:hypothetical protein